MNHKWVRLTLRTAGWLACVAGVAALVLHFAGLSSDLGMYLTAGTPYLVVAALVAPVLFAATRSWVSLVAAVSIGAAGIWTQAPLYAANAATGPGTAVTAMTSNIYFGAGDAAAVVGTAAANNVDMLTVQELTHAAVQRLEAAGLSRLLPFHYLVPGMGAEGTGIWSKYPLQEQREYPGFIFNQLSAKMIHPRIGPVQVYGLHPAAPMPTADRWHQEMGTLRAVVMERTPGRAILAGDFNSTHDHAAYRALLANGLADTGDQAGAGRLATWPTDRAFGPLIGIDHILVAEGTAKTVKSVTIPGADHKSVIATIEFPDGHH